MVQMGLCQEAVVFPIVPRGRRNREEALLTIAASFIVFFVSFVTTIAHKKPFCNTEPARMVGTGTSLSP